MSTISAFTKHLVSEMDPFGVWSGDFDEQDQRVASLAANTLPQEEQIAQTNLEGYYVFSIDIPGPYEKFEIHFDGPNSFTYRGAGIDQVGPLLNGSYQFNQGVLEGRIVTTDGLDEINLNIDFRNARFAKILDHTHTQMDPQEIPTGTAIKTGAQVLVGEPGNIMVPWRVLKLEESFFSSVENL